MAQHNSNRQGRGTTFHAPEDHVPQTEVQELPEVAPVSEGERINARLALEALAATVRLGSIPRQDEIRVSLQRHLDKVTEADDTMAALSADSYGDVANAVFAGEIKLAAIGFGDDSQSLLCEAMDDLLDLHRQLGGSQKDWESKFTVIPLDGVPGESRDLTLAKNIREAHEELGFTVLLISPELRGAEAQTTELIRELSYKHQFVAVHPHTAKLVRRVLRRRAGKFHFHTAEQLAAVINSQPELHSLMQAEVSGNMVTVTNGFYHDAQVLMTFVVEADGTVMMDGVPLKRRNAILAANARFAAGGDTLIAVMDSRGALSIALDVLSDVLADTSKYAVSKILHGWKKGIEGMLVDRPINQRKQDVGTRLFNRDNVMGAYTVIQTSAGIVGSARVNTAVVSSQLRHTLGEDGTIFVPSAKGDYLITYSPIDKVGGHDTVWFRVNGQLAAWCKGSKHTAAHHANLAGTTTLRVMVMPRTPFCQGGAMPVTDDVLENVVGFEPKTLVNAYREYITAGHLHARVNEGMFKLLVKPGDLVVPDQPLAVMDGQIIRWSAKKAKGAHFAYITEAELALPEVITRPRATLKVRAMVGYQGVFKGRVAAKVMATPCGPTKTELVTLTADGTEVPFSGAFLSSGAIKVDTRLTGAFGNLVETTTGRITRVVTEAIFAELVSKYSEAGSHPDSRFSYDHDTFTVSWTDEVNVYDMEFGIESSPVGDTFGYTGLIPTQIAFVTAADAHGEKIDNVGPGTRVLRSIYGNRIAERTERMTYAKLSGSFARTPVLFADGPRPVRGWVTLDRSRGAETHNGIEFLAPRYVTRSFATPETAPKLREIFDLNDSDVTILRKMSQQERFRTIVVLIDHEGVRYATEVDTKQVLALTDAGSETGQLSGVGNTAAELIRCVLFPEVAANYRTSGQQMQLLVQFQKQLHKLARFSHKLNQLYRHKLGTIAKVVPSWALPENTWAVDPTSEVAVLLAKQFACKVDELDGKYGIVGRHPVSAVAVRQVRLITGLGNVFLVNESDFRTFNLGDTDGDQGFLLPIKDEDQAKSLQAAISKMVPGGDLRLAVLGIHANDPRCKLFGEVPKSTETLENIGHKLVTKSEEAWVLTADEQAHTAVATCGSAYKLGEFASFLAGLGQISITAALVGAVLYEDRGLCGDVTSLALKTAFSLFFRGLQTRRPRGRQTSSFHEFKLELEKDLAEGLGESVVLDHQTHVGLGVASEFVRCAAEGAIPKDRATGVELIDRIGGPSTRYDELWRVVAVLQAMARGHIDRVDDLIVDMTLDSVMAAKKVVGENFLLDMAEIVARIMQPSVKLLHDNNVLREGPAAPAHGGDDDGRFDDEEEEFAFREKYEDESRFADE